MHKPFTSLSSGSGHVDLWLPHPKGVDKTNLDTKERKLKSPCHQLFDNASWRTLLFPLNMLSSLLRFTFFAGKKAKSPNVAIDHDLAEGLVDLEKLKATMQRTLDSLQLEFQDKLSVKIQPSEF